MRKRLDKLKLGIFWSTSKRYPLQKIRSFKLYHMRSRNQSNPHMGPSERGSGHWLPDYASLLLKIMFLLFLEVILTVKNYILAISF